MLGFVELFFFLIRVFIFISFVIMKVNLYEYIYIINETESEGM